MEAIKTVAELMEVSAITAPKAVGQNFIVTRTIEGEDIGRLADDMEAFGKETGKKNFDRDGANVRNSDAVVLIGMKDAAVPGLDCAACGHPVCLEINSGEQNGEFLGPQCAIRLLDMGIAIGSAVKTAQMMNVDNRIMYRIGVSARRMGLIDADFVMGVPLSVTGKSIYYDRK
ncbi:MAG: ferredoxin domain-containing protein [Alkalispirochaetaceae bacterium]